LPVILLTARAQQSDVETGFALGADDYILKPFSPRELARRVAAVIARSPVR
jgi:DNA-binding response OmpR family regulator